MLAGDCAWAILDAEHARIRALATRMREVLASQALACESAATLGKLLATLHAFDASTHRPKGTLLIGLLRSKSAELAGQVDDLERERAHCDQLLTSAMDAVSAADNCDPKDAAQARTALHLYLDNLLAHMDREDALLREPSRRLLTGEEWAAIVSSISEVVATPPDTRAATGERRVTTGENTNGKGE